MIISLTKLAYWTFQSCRHRREDAALLLDILATHLEAAKKDGLLMTALTDDQLKRIATYVLADIEVGPDAEAAPKIDPEAAFNIAGVFLAGASLPGANAVSTQAAVRAAASRAKRVSE